MQLTRTGDADQRLAAIAAVVRIDPRTKEEFVATLAGLLKQELAGSTAGLATLASAMSLLGECGPAARSATNVLLQATQHTNARVRGTALDALSKVDPDTFKNLRER